MSSFGGFGNILEFLLLSCLGNNFAWQQVSLLIFILVHLCLLDMPGTIRLRNFGHFVAEDEAKALGRQTIIL